VSPWFKTFLLIFTFPKRTSAGLYYFSAKMASEKQSALASWITGWSNITGQVTLICSINYSWLGLLFAYLAAPFTTALAPNLSQLALQWRLMVHLC
jgi:hypothetical protein